MPIEVSITKSNKTEKYLEAALDFFSDKKLVKIAEDSLEDFKRASPTEEIANSWSYEIINFKGKTTISFNNSYTVNGENLAIIINYGHGTGNGKWVSGINYLDEPTKKAFEKIMKKTWEALKAYERH